MRFNIIQYTVVHSMGQNLLKVYYIWYMKHRERRIQYWIDKREYYQQLYAYDIWLKELHMKFIYESVACLMFKY